MVSRGEARAESLVIGLVYGGLGDSLYRNAFPIASKTKENGAYDIGGGIVDLAVVFGLAAWAIKVDPYQALLAKVGYNTLVQIAPDVVKLAKNRVFQRAR